MYYENNDINLYYEVYGNNKYNNILILPGWGDTRKTFYRLINKLKENNKVYIFDYPGFGNTVFPDKDLTIYDFATIFKNFINDNNINNPTIIAHSFGGRIAIILATYYKMKLNKLVFMDIAGIRRKSIKRFFKEKIYKLRKKLTFLLPKNKRIKYLIKLRHKYSSNDYIMLHNNMYNTFKSIIHTDLRKYVSSINNEVLILWGYKDNDTPINDGYYYNRKIKRSSLIIFPKGTHFVYLDYPSIDEIILNFIEKNEKIFFN